MSRVCNIEVTPRKGEATERMIKRFSKMCKKNNIIRDFLEKTSCFKTKRERRRMKQERNRWLRNKYKFRRK